VPFEVAFDRDEMMGYILKSPKKTTHKYRRDAHQHKLVVSVCIEEISVLASVAIPVD